MTMSDDYVEVPGGGFRLIRKKPEAAKAFEATPPITEGIVRACQRHPDVMREVLYRVSIPAGSAVAELPDNTFVPCERCEAENRALVDILRRGREAKVPEAYLMADLRQLVLDPAVLSELERYQARPRGFLVLSGPPGTGKSHIACSMCNVIPGSFYVTQTALVAAMRRRYRDYNAPDMVRQATKALLLGLDEFGRGVGGSDVETMLHELIDARYSRDLPTVLATNLTVAEIKEAMGDALADRLRGDLAGVVTLTGESHRGRPEDTRELRRKLLARAEALR